MTAQAVAALPPQEKPSERRARRLQTFHPDFRRAVQELTAACAPIEDLAESFPALLFALATGYGENAARLAAFRLVQQGAPLKKAAETLALPWWTRRLPARAFTAPLRKLPDGPDFNERVISHLPITADSSEAWFTSVQHAHLGCHAEFALWTAAWMHRQPRAFRLTVGPAHFRLMSAWAWYSERPDSLAFGLMRRAWSTQMGLRRAIEELHIWRRRMRLCVMLGRGLTEVWMAEGSMNGLDFVALRTADDFVAESKAMENCLDQYAERMEEGRSRVFSIRRNGHPVADVEIGLQDLEPNMPLILQLKGPRNRLAPPEVWQATYAWLGTQKLKPIAAIPIRRGSAAARQNASAIWQPYLNAVEPLIAEEMCRTIEAEFGVKLTPGMPPRAPRKARAKKASPRRVPALE